MRCVSAAILIQLLSISGSAHASFYTPYAAPDPAPPPRTTSVAEKIEPPKPVKITPKISAEREFRLGIDAYENGLHRKSQQLLKHALSIGLSSNSNKAVAYKYLAFMACANKQLDACKTYFHKAIMIDPRFDLRQEEAGHPVWGEAFKEAKAERNAKGKVKHKNER